MADNEKEVQQVLQYIANETGKIAQETYLLAKEKAAKIDKEHTRLWPKKPGHLEDAIKLEMLSDDLWRIYIDETIAPHARYVILGTSKMVSRDFITEAVIEVKQKYGLTG